MKTKPCPDCEGRGRKMIYSPDPHDFEPPEDTNEILAYPKRTIIVPCPKCLGSGIAMKE